MRRTTLLILAVGMLLALTAGVAVAKEVRGDRGDNRLVGTINRDVIYGLGGNDTIYALAGNDRVEGNNGNDKISGGQGADRLFGGKNADTISGAPGDDVIAGDAGNDTLRAQAGRDRVTGGPGGDFINTASDGQRDSITCGTGTDRVIVDLNDVVDGQLVSSVLSAPGQVVSILSCERVELRLLQ